MKILLFFVLAKIRNFTLIFLRFIDDHAQYYKEAQLGTQVLHRRYLFTINLLNSNSLNVTCLFIWKNLTKLYFPKFHDLINEKIESNASHDFDVISHESCSYDDPGKGIQVDVEKVVGSIFGGNEVRHPARYA